MALQLSLSAMLDNRLWKVFFRKLCIFGPIFFLAVFPQTAAMDALSQFLFAFGVFAL
jgi:hypothetical protein